MQIVKYIDRTPIGYEKISVTEVAVVRLDATLRAASRAAFLTVEDVSIRYRVDGGDPDQNDGHVVIAGNNLWLNEPHAIDDLRMIAVGVAVTAIVIVTYYF